MIDVVRGSLVELAVDALVRPIRSDLAPVSALSRDIGTAAGPDMEERLQRLGTIPVGGAALTPAGALPAAFLIHVVVMSEDEAQSSPTVQRALRNALRRAADWSLDSLALPPLGLGAGSIEPEASARALLEVLFDHLDEGVAPLALTVVVTSEFEEELFGRLVDELSGERARD